MNPVVAVIAPGMMGAAVGQRLSSRGLKVLTSLAGRSAETAARAKAAGMTGASDEEIAAADFILSIVPPADAIALAERFAPVLSASNSKPVFVDCNAVAPRTVDRIAAVLAPTGAPFVDAGIVGGPPKADDAGPRFYASGSHAAQFATLKPYGLDVRVLAGKLSAASAMKMSYAGIMKGTQAIGTAMLLAAARSENADTLYKELQHSQKEMLWWFNRQLAIMPPKAARWVAEMREISEFVSADSGGRELFEGAALLYEQIGEDFDGDKKDLATLTAFLDKAKAAG